MSEVKVKSHTPRRSLAFGAHLRFERPSSPHGLIAYVLATWKALHKTCPSQTQGLLLIYVHQLSEPRQQHVHSLPKAITRRRAELNIHSLAVRLEADAL